MNFLFKVWDDSCKNVVDRFTSFKVLFGDEVSLLEFQNLNFELKIIEVVELLLMDLGGSLE